VGGSAGDRLSGDAGRYRKILQAAGFRILSERDRREFALEFFAAMKARFIAAWLGGPTAPLKMDNMVANLKNGPIAPVEMIAAQVRRRGRSGYLIQINTLS